MTPPLQTSPLGNTDGAFCCILPHAAVWVAFPPAIQEPHDPGASFSVFVFLPRLLGRSELGFDFIPDRKCANSGSWARSKPSTVTICLWTSVMSFHEIATALTSEVGSFL